MIRSILLLACITLSNMVIAAEVCSQQQAQDTIAVNHTESDVDTQDDDEDPDDRLSYLLKQTGDIRWELFTWGLGCGIILPLKGTDMMSIGGEVKYDMLLGVRMRLGNHSVSTGISFDCRWYSPKGDKGFMKTDDGKLITIPYPDNSKGHYSYLQVGSLQIPVLYGFSFGTNRDFGVMAGPVVNFNLFGNMKTSHTMKSDVYDTRTSFETNRIGQTPVTLEIMGVARYKYIGLYARYAPMRMFHASTGINVSSLSLGLILMFGAI